MKLVQVKCPNCGAQITTKDSELVCEYCGCEFMVDEEPDLLDWYENEENKLRESENDERQYDFDNDLVNTDNTDKSEKAATKQTDSKEKKKHGCFYYILSILFFPVPITKAMLKDDSFKKKTRYIIIGASWIIYIALIAALSISTAIDEKKTKVPDAPAAVDFVADHLNDILDDKLIYDSDFDPIDKTGPHYIDESAMIVSNISAGKTFLYKNSQIDIAVCKSRNNKITAYLIAKELSLDDCCDLIHAAFPLLDQRIKEDAIDTMISNIKSSGFPDAYTGFIKIDIAETDNGYSLKLYNIDRSFTLPVF